MSAHAFKPDPFGHRDICDEKVDEGDGKTRLCGYKRSEHSQPERTEQTAPPVVYDEPIPAPPPRLPETWLVDAAGNSVRFCRPHETLSFNPQTARALAAALLAAVEEAERA